MTAVASVVIEISPAELLDRLTILELKLARIDDPVKLANIRREYTSIRAVREASIPDTAVLHALYGDLAAINAALWDVEEGVRACERKWSFGPNFVDLARSVYRLNDERGRIKRDIDILLGARFREEKSHALPDGPV